jgi:hypothetical protein
MKSKSAFLLSLLIGLSVFFLLSSKKIVEGMDGDAPISDTSVSDSPDSPDSPVSDSPTIVDLTTAVDSDAIDSSAGRRPSNRPQGMPDEGESSDIGRRPNNRPQIMTDEDEPSNGEGDERDRRDGHRGPRRRGNQYFHSRGTGDGSYTNSNFFPRIPFWTVPEFEFQDEYAQMPVVSETSATASNASSSLSSSPQINLLPPVALALGLVAIGSLVMSQ